MSQREHWSRRPGALPVVAILAVWGALIATLAWQRPIHLDDPPDAPRLAARPDMRLDLNRASAGQLQNLPLVGPAMSARIIADREANGPFASLEDLQRVPGVGPRTIALIEEYVVVDEVEQD